MAACGLPSAVVVERSAGGQSATAGHRSDADLLHSCKRTYRPAGRYGSVLAPVYGRGFASDSDLIYI